LRVSDVRFGWSVDIDGDRIIIAAAPEVNEGVGAAYVYELSEKGSWELLATIAPLDTTGRFGGMTAISGDWVAIGTPGMLNGTGQVYLYSLPDLKETILQDSDQGMEMTYFGTGLDLFGNTLMVGASNHVMVYQLHDRAWDFVVTLPAHDHFPPSLSTDGSTLVIGNDDYPFGEALVYESVVVVDAPALIPASHVEYETGQFTACAPYSNYLKSMFLTILVIKYAVYNF